MIAMHGVVGCQRIVSESPNISDTRQSVNKQGFDSESSQADSRVKTTMTRPYEQRLVNTGPQIGKGEGDHSVWYEWHENIKEALNSPTIKTAASSAVN